MAIKCFYHPVQYQAPKKSIPVLANGGFSHPNITRNKNNVNFSSNVGIGRPLKAQAALFPFLRKKDRIAVKEQLLEAIGPLDRGAEASSEDQIRVNEIVQELESINPTKEPLKSALLNGKWELLYTTSETILKRQRPKILRPSGPIYQAINTDSLRAQNMETWPFFNQVTANLTPLSGRKVAVKFDKFKIAGLISITAPPQARGELDITYLDDELRVSRGDKGNLFILKMIDPDYKIPL
uniref:Plastid lipid-associated protein/fibrillin conserved domain-containing protein n=1 Tax=Araucaria cunninghamii TaxID=56994 RepID=A0A0D6R7R5_ARACU